MSHQFNPLRNGTSNLGQQHRPQAQFSQSQPLRGNVGGYDATALGFHDANGHLSESMGNMHNTPAAAVQVNQLTNQYVPDLEAHASLYGVEYSPAHSSQGSNFSGSCSSGKFPSQGSDFFCPASPTYSYEVPRMSQSSQEFNSSQSSQNSDSNRSELIQESSFTNGNYSDLHPYMYQYLEYSDLLPASGGTGRSGSESGSSQSQSQPEAKKMRMSGYEDNL